MTSKETASDVRSVLSRLSRAKVPPIVTFENERHADPLGEALVAGGISVTEVTLRTSQGLAAIERLSSRGDLLVGAGTSFPESPPRPSFSAATGWD